MINWGMGDRSRIIFQCCSLFQNASGETTLLSRSDDGIFAEDLRFLWVDFDTLILPHPFMVIGVCFRIMTIHGYRMTLAVLTHRSEK